ncbi:hypothetical protein FPHYL_13858 [Fusarium phyllophilum]|uniref:Uncharacterized protein n=1 Tax=Fusarium phyllophilum TaxID=47803 RepID=A0A8H5MK07_9HYPO|nr:hypothetical protein FPHYL_13858 [Fusarium phyllophilum]
MSSFTPINARQMEEKRRPQAKRCYWCVVMGSLEERCEYWDRPYEKGRRCDDEMHHDKKEDAAVEAETKATMEEETQATVKAEHEAPAQPAAERPVVEERASVASSSGSSSSSNKVNNRKTCARCNGKEYNMSNFKDHNKVHFLEDHGVPARFPCNGCKEPGKCIVARCPKHIETYACINCLKSHRQCSFNGLKAERREKCKPGVHPALLRPVSIVKA